MRLLAALAAAAVLVGCGSERSAVTAGGRVVGDNLTVYTSVPDPARSVGRDMVDASKLAIAQAGGKVGDFGINFVAVDEGSTGSPDPPRVAGAAAEEVIRDAQVIAVVGAVRSDTALTSLPLFNEAGLLLVSPGAGYAGFTSPVAAGEPDRWYPVRPPDLRARDRGRHRAGAGPAARRRPREGGDRGRGRQGRRRAGGGAYRAGGIAARGGCSARRRGDLRRQRRAKRSRGVAESLTREVPSARLVFGDELTRAGLPGRLAPAARRRAVFVTAAPRARLDPGAARLRARLRGAVRTRARPVRRAGLAGHERGARRARRRRTACQPAPRGGRALSRLAAAQERLQCLPEARRRAECL